jgi:hypothetical protein
MVALSRKTGLGVVVKWKGQYVLRFARLLERTERPENGMDGLEGNFTRPRRRRRTFTRAEFGIPPTRS